MLVSSHPEIINRPSVIINQCRLLPLLPTPCVGHTARGPHCKLCVKYFSKTCSAAKQKLVTDSKTTWHFVTSFVCSCGKNQAKTSKI